MKDKIQCHIFVTYVSVSHRLNTITPIITVILLLEKIISAHFIHLIKDYKQSYIHI